MHRARIIWIMDEFNMKSYVAKLCSWCATCAFNNFCNYKWVFLFLWDSIERFSFMAHTFMGGTSLWISAKNKEWEWTKRQKKTQLGIKLVWLLCYCNCYKLPLIGTKMCCTYEDERSERCWNETNFIMSDCADFII